MSKKVTYRNELPPLPADCLLPQFTVPCLSPDFSLENHIHREVSQSWLSDSLLGVNIELADLSVYNEKVHDGDLIEKDVRYMPDFAGAAKSRNLVMSTAAMSRPQARPEVQRPKKTTKATYRKSKIFKSADDPEIQEQLKCAFGDNIPEGEVCLIRKAPDLKSVMIRLGAENVDTTKVLLLSKTDSKGKRYLKVVPSSQPKAEAESTEGAEETPVTGVSATRAYRVSCDNSAKMKGYWYVEDGVYNMGEIKTRYVLRAMPPKEMRETEITGTPVKFEEEE